MPDVPHDPELRDRFQRLNGGALALLSVFDTISEILVFELENHYNPGTPEFEAAANVLEGAKIMIAEQQVTLVNAARALLDQ